MVPLLNFLRRQTPVARRGQKLPGHTARSRIAIATLLALTAPHIVLAQDSAGASASESSSTTEDTAVADQAVAVLQGLEDDQTRRTIQDATTEIETAPAGQNKTSLIKRVTDVLTGDKNFSDARRVALSDDNGDQTEKARTLVLIAKAERASGQAAQAWFTLHEAQQIALTLSDPESVVGVFREIGAVEHQLTQDAMKQGRSTLGTLDPKSGDVIGNVLDYGLPPEGYHEIEVLRTGGGPLREPTIVRHRYFYNGDRFFQGPNLRGGQTIVQAIHPRTQCLSQCRVTLPAGAPIVTYTEHQIRYLYPEVAVVLDFERDGDVELEFRQTRNPHKRLQRKLTGRQTQTALQLPGSGTASTLKNALRLGVGNPLELTTRLPVLSDLLNRDTRVPGSLTPPK